MADYVDLFRTKLSEELRTAMLKRDKETTSTIRSLMSALDNASALSKEEISQLPDSSIPEVPRKNLSKADIERVLTSELNIREAALKDFERIGNKAEAEVVARSVATIQRLVSALD